MEKTSRVAYKEKSEQEEAMRDIDRLGKRKREGER